MADFTNIDGVYAKDTELRSGIDTLRTTVLSNTIKPLTITKNDTYTAIPSSGTYGYSPITVDVQEEPWTPLQDGYSNFWFELTDDTLSPWLNFSAKTESAVIDWGDGSGEVSLDTLTPTHTYSKAGRYVVKCKGVTGIGRQHSAPYNPPYYTALNYVELNNEVITIYLWGFYLCTGLKKVVVYNKDISILNNAFYICPTLKSTVFPQNSTITSVSNSIYQACYSLIDATLPPNAQTIGNNLFYQCTGIRSITIPASVTFIDNSAFAYCSSLSEVHCHPTSPPTLGTNVFNSLPSDWICYVPVGTGDTYKSAAGWSSYADHILEEGQTPNRAMLAKFENTKKSDDTEEMR